MIFGHGDDSYRYGDKVKMDFSSNLPRFADISAVKAHLAANLDVIGKYPEPEARELEAMIADRDVQIAQQGEQIETLNEDVSNLSAENAQKQETIQKQDKDLNAAWFVFGTKAELKEQKILQSGDVLKSSNFNRDYFTKIDIRVDKEIKLYSKSAKVLTSHPANTYTLTKDAKGQYVLRITNPTQFWSASKYLVIQVK